MNPVEPIAVSERECARTRITLTTVFRSIGRLAVWRPYEPGTHHASWSVAPDPSSVPRTRRITRARLIAWKLEGFTDVVELLVSELVTNALHHAPGPIRLTLWFTDAMLRCEVEDAATELPSMRDHSVDDERGRGLRLLDALTCCWGAVPISQGKIVWFELPTTPAHR